MIWYPSRKDSPRRDGLSVWIAVATASQGVAVSPDGGRLSVTHAVLGNVSVIDTATLAVVATVTAGATPRGVGVTPDGTRVYVANRFGDNASVIDTTSLTVVATLTVGAQPASFPIVFATPNAIVPTLSTRAPIAVAAVLLALGARRLRRPRTAAASSAP